MITYQTFEWRSWWCICASQSSNSFQVFPSYICSISKNLFWCILNVNFCHNNFAKLHRSHMTLNPFEIFLETCKAMSTTVSQNFSSFDFIKWEILLLPWSHLKLGPKHKMTYNLLLTTPNSLRFWETHKIYVCYIFQIFNSIGDDHTELSLSKEIDFKIEVETLDTWISLNTYPNDLKFFSHI
jgi:hypothetical protein